MNKERDIEQARYKKIIIFAEVIVAVLLVNVLWLECQQDKQYTEWIQQLERKSDSYEKQIKQIQNELNARQREINRDNKRSWAMPCFIIRNTSELKQAEQWIEKYKITASIVVPYSIKEKEQSSIFQKIAENHANRKNIDIMLSGSLSEKEIWNYISESKKQLKKYGLDFSDFWYFEQGENTEDNIKKLSEHGFAGYSQMTTYGKTLMSGKEDGGMLYIEHVPVKMGNNKIKSTLNLCKQQNNAAAFSFDMDVLNQLDEEDSTKLIKEVMEMLQVRSENQEVTIYNATQIQKQSQYLKKSLKQKQKEYEEYAQKEEQKIRKLEDKSDKIWERWSEWKKQ